MHYISSSFIYRKPRYCSFAIGIHYPVVSSGLGINDLISDDDYDKPPN